MAGPGDVFVDGVKLEVDVVLVAVEETDRGVGGVCFVLHYQPPAKKNTSDEKKTIYMYERMKVKEFSKCSVP